MRFESSMPRRGISLQTSSSTREPLRRMTRYVITADVALQLAEQKAVVTASQLVAPTLLRSQVLSILYQRVRDGQLEKSEAEVHLDYIRGLRIRLLGDRVLQSVAWKMAAELDWPDTLNAEYVALTKLQADALVTNDAGLRKAASKLVPVVSYDQFLSSREL